MLSEILTITSVYFLIGFVVTLIINKKADAETKRQRWVKYIVYFVIVNAMFLVIYLQGYYFLIVALAISIIGFFELVYNYIKKPLLSKFTLSASLIVYTALAGAFITFSFEQSRLILVIYLLVIIFDGFSQLSGQLFGKTKFSNISPNKTVEGCIGGLVFTIVSALLFREKINTSVNNVIALSLIVCASSLCGDLLASWYKRKLQIKDYSNLIPGHGGVLDRFDSFIMTGAIWFLMNALQIL